MVGMPGGDKGRALPGASGRTVAGHGGRVDDKQLTGGNSKGKLCDKLLGNVRESGFGASADLWRCPAKLLKWIELSGIYRKVWRMEISHEGRGSKILPRAASGALPPPRGRVRERGLRRRGAQRVYQGAEIVGRVVDVW